MELEELAEVHRVAAYKKKKEIFEKQLNLLINDSNLFRDFRDKMRKIIFIFFYSSNSLLSIYNVSFAYRRVEEEESHTVEEANYG